MFCPKNRKTALWGLIRLEWLHRWKRYRIERDHWYWKVEYQCETCGARRMTHYVKDEELIRWGYDIADLREKFPADGFGYVLCADLEPKCPS